MIDPLLLIAAIASAAVTVIVASYFFMCDHSEKFDEFELILLFLGIASMTLTILAVMKLLGG